MAKKRAKQEPTTAYAIIIEGGEWDSCWTDVDDVYFSETEANEIAEAHNVKAKRRRIHNQTTATVKPVRLHK